MTVGAGCHARSLLRAEILERGPGTCAFLRRIIDSDINITRNTLIFLSKVRRKMIQSIWKDPPEILRLIDVEFGF